MEELQKAFDKASAEVTDLAKEKTNLIQDVMVLKSKKRYLIADIDKRKESLAAVEKSHADSKARQADDLLVVRNDIAEANKGFAKLENQITVKQTELKDIEEKIKDADIKASEQLKLKKTEAADAEKRKQTALDEFEGLNKKVAAQEGKLSNLAEMINHTDAVAKDEIAKIKARTKAADKELTEVNDKISSAIRRHEDLEAQVSQKQTELDVATKKHAAYLEYEKRVNKVLQAREQAIWDRENELSIMSRRSSILDKL